MTVDDPGEHTAAEAAAVLRRLLDIVHEGEIDASSQLDTRLRRRVEGAIIAFERSCEEVESRLATEPTSRTGRKRRDKRR